MALKRRPEILGSRIETSWSTPRIGSLVMVDWTKRLGEALFKLDAEPLMAICSWPSCCVVVQFKTKPILFSGADLRKERSD